MKVFVEVLKSNWLKRPGVCALLRFNGSTVQRFNKAQIVWLVPLLLSGCATYHSKPLPTQPDLLPSPALTVPVSQFNLPGLKPHPFNPANGLDETEVITLAVLNNPDLKAARLQAGVAAAQLLEAGLLPDPVVSGGIAKSPNLTGYNIGLGEDLQALITRGAAKAAAKAHATQVNLEILWQEWQVAEKARNLFIQACADQQLKHVLATTRDLLAQRYRQDKNALRQGDLAADHVSADLAALSKADSNLRRLDLNANQTRHDLNQLLGLKPNLRLRLKANSEALPISKEQFQEAVSALPQHRADLLALQAGYQSQEERLREAILAQFPSMSAGLEESRDPVEGVHTMGLTVNLTLPLFNRNRGQIAIQRATRALLRQTYQARLDQAVSQADEIWQATQIMARRLEVRERRLRTQKKVMAAAQRNYQRGNLDAAAYLDMKLNWQTEQVEIIRLRASLQRARGALEILLGLPLEAAAK